MEEGSPREHILSRFDDDLNGLRALVLRMGDSVHALIEKSARAITSNDVGSARQIVHREKWINELDMEGQEEGVRILATHSPVARDLRLVISLTRSIVDLERMADQAKKVAQIVLHHDADAPGTQPDKVFFEDITVISDEVCHMFTQAMQAVAHGNLDVAVAVVQADARLDQLFEGAMRRLTTYLLEDHRNIRAVMDAILALKAMQRVGDHTANIAENMIFAIKGKDVRYIKAEHLSAGYLDD